MPRQTNLQIAEQNRRNQIKFMAERGTTREAYIAFYAQYGRDWRNATAIWAADMDALRRCEDRIDSLLSRRASRRMIPA